MKIPFLFKKYQAPAPARVRPFLFFHIPKTGGMSLIKMGKCQNPPLLISNGHITVERLRKQVGERFDSAFRFGFVRNPFDRFVSAYHYLRHMTEDNPYWPDDHEKKKTLEQFSDFAEFCARFDEIPEMADYLAFRPMAYWVCENGRSVLDFTGRFESLEEDVRRLAPQIGLHVPLQKHNTSAHKPWRSYYEAGHCVDLVRRLYAEDFDLFSYSADIQAGTSRREKPSPAVSVIIPAYQAWEALPRCLAALERQEGWIAFEAIVVASGADGSEAALRQRFPGVQILALPERKTPGAARNIGAGRARGDILLFIDADCALAPDGVRRALETHRRFEQPLVGGAIEPGKAQSYAAWGQYFSSLTPWMPGRGSEPAPITDVAAGCCSIKRRAFERLGPFSEDRFCEDTLLSWRVSQAGFAPLFDPGLRVCHDGLDSLARLLGRKFRHGRAYAALRAREQHWTKPQRWLRIAAAPAVPGLMLWRAGYAVWRGGRHRLRFALASPVTLVALIAWAAGEAGGLLSSGPAEASPRQGQ